MSDTVRVRIKIAIGVDGSWNASGHGDKDGPAEDSGEWVLDGMPENLRLEDIRIMYIEADVLKPTIPVISGDVVP